jgi:hypothetical protein
MYREFFSALSTLTAAGSGRLHFGASRKETHYRVTDLDFAKNFGASVTGFVRSNGK